MNIFSPLQFFTCLLVIFAAEVTTGVFAFIGKGVVSKYNCFLMTLKYSLYGKGFENIDTHSDILKLVNLHN